MVYNDETPFFWLGDTHWQMPDYEKDDECNYGDNCGSQFKHVVKDRMAKGFTVYQTYPDAGVNDGGVNDATDARVAAYKSIQCGSLGFTYGVSGIWAMKWDTKVAGWDSYSKYPWYVGVDAPGSTYMKYLKQFYTSFAWEKLVPRFSDPVWCTFVTPESSILSSTSDAERFVVYFYNNSKTTGTLKNLTDSKTYCAVWFDPTTGKNLPISDAVKSTGGIYTIPLRPDNKDWLLLVEDVNAKSNLPVGEDKAVSIDKVATTSSSSASGFSGKQAVDYSPQTYWCAANGSFPQWLSVDLGANTKLSLIQTKFYANELWKYRIEGSEDNTNWISLVNHSTGAVGYLMNDSVSGNFRYIRLTVTGASVDWAAVREFSVFTKTNSEETKIEDVTLSQKGEDTFLAFPNPGKGSMNMMFNLQKPSNAEIQIFNIQGQLIENLGSKQYNSGAHILEWEDSQQPEGIYFAVLKLNDKMLRSKIVILK